MMLWPDSLDGVKDRDVEGPGLSGQRRGIA